jgi:hypothetical protein
LIIGRDQFNAASGLVYPDGTVRRIAQVEAVMNAPAAGFAEKPDEEGLPIQHDIPVLQAKYFAACVQDGVTEITWRERVTLVESLLALPGGLGGEAQRAREVVAEARRAYDAGDHQAAFTTVAGLIDQAAAPFREHPPQPAPPFALQATIYRDVYGIPHIFADSEETAAYAIARAQCDDMGMRVFDSLRCGIGRQSEVLGEASLESDRIMHLWRVPETAERMWRESPLRGEGPYNMLGVDDGTRSQANWQGRIPFDSLPQVHDPASGWLQSCNTAANYVTEGYTLRAEDFPPGVVCGHYFPDGRTWRGRGRRCFEVLSAMKDVTLEQAREFALGTYAPGGPIWAKPLCAAYDAQKQRVPDPDLSMKMMVDAVRTWDYQVRKGASALPLSVSGERNTASSIPKPSARMRPTALRRPRPSNWAP